MFNQINKIFDFNQIALNLYSKRQEILSSNIANVDTPRYKAIDINFNKELNKILKQKDIKKTNIKLKKTSLNHLNVKNNNTFSLEIKPVINREIKLDGNTVNIDRERIEFVNNSLKYEASLSFIKNEIKNMIYVLQG